MTAYYNEIDPYAAQWLRNLIAAGHIAPGDVDTRSILDVSPDDLTGYTQCHFFAGIGVWSHALRWGGWPDDRPVWTGSCPCQPFSMAGMGGGMDDQRHLWPYWFHLIEQRRPAVVFGEQVEAAIRYGWLDLVQSDLEGIHYAFAATGIPAAGVGAPHIRQRIFFVADTDAARLQSGGGHGSESRGQECGRHAHAGSRTLSGLADATCQRPPSNERQKPGIFEGAFPAKSSGMLSGVEHPGGQRRERGQATAPGHHDDGQASDRAQSEHGVGESGPHRISEHPAGPVNGFWRNADWLLCRDGKWRPVEPGAFPLAHGATARVGRLRAYGNAICAPLAAEFISAYLECRPS